MRTYSDKTMLKTGRSGQGMIEYILAFVAVVVVLVAILGPGGIFSSRVNQSLGDVVNGAACMTDAICYDPDGCESICP